MRLAEAAACSNIRAARRLIEEEGADVNERGEAALWGDADMVKYLLSAGADANAANDHTRWTALHAAAFQEHSKVCHLLLQGGARADVEDNNGVTAADYASISEAIWPFFASKGCTRTGKRELIDKGIVKRVESGGSAASAGSTGGFDGSGGKGSAAAPQGALRHISRPGSAYVRAVHDPTSAARGGFGAPRRTEDSRGRPVGGYRAVGIAGGAGGEGTGPLGITGRGRGPPPRGPRGAIDPLADDDDDMGDARALGRSASLRGFGL